MYELMQELELMGKHYSCVTEGDWVACKPLNAAQLVIA